MTTVLTVLALVVLGVAVLIGAVLLAGTVAIVTGMWTYTRRARRSRTWRRGLLVAGLARSATSGRGGNWQVARLRIRLFDAMDSTSRTMASVGAPESVTDLAGELYRAATATDQRLRALVTEPDAEVLNPILRVLRDDVDRLCRASSEVRSTAWRFHSDLNRGRTADLTREISDQVAGLRAGLAEVQALTGRPYRQGQVEGFITS